MSWPPPPPPSGLGHLVPRTPEPLHAAVLRELATSLVMMDKDRALGIAHARDVLRTGSWTWPAVLTGALDDYPGRLLLYGYQPRPTSIYAPAHSPPTPPEGRLPNGAWRDGWMAVCARAVAARVAWAPVPVMAETALLAAQPCPMAEQVARADALMRQIWTEVL